MNPLRTNTGFLTCRPSDASPSDQFYGSPVASKLYQDMVNHPDLTATWEWRSKAIIAARDLLLMNPDFFKVQVFSGIPMSARTIDFIHSTLTFIMTGKRQLPTILWNDVLDYHPSDLNAVSDKTKDHFKSLFSMVMNNPVHKLLAMWLSQPGGFEDMLTTMFIIFGDLPENWQHI
jgi:hypothetical protein